MSDPMAAAFGGGNGSGDDNGDDDRNKKKGKAAIAMMTSDSSTIGEPSDDDEDDDQQDDDQTVEIKSSSLDCLDALEASLPMKRGLSSTYDGKSKSFCNLFELGTEDVKDLVKKEHIVNKKRRLIISHDIKPLKCTSSSTMSSITSMPSLDPNDVEIPSVDHHNNEDDDDDNGDDDEDVKKVGYDAGEEKEGK